MRKKRNGSRETFKSLTAMKFWNSDDQVNRTLIVAILWRLARILTGESLIVVAVSNHGPPWTGTVIQIRPPREMIVACLYLFMIRFVFSQSNPFSFFCFKNCLQSSIQFRNKYSSQEPRTEFRNPKRNILSIDRILVQFVIHDRLVWNEKI